MSSIQIAEGIWKLPEHCSKQQVLRALALVEADRDRYRQALTLIWRGHYEGPECLPVKAIADHALSDSGAPATTTPDPGFSREDER